MNFFQRRAFHPLLIGVVPALALLANNLTRMNPRIGVRSVILSIIFSAFLFLGLKFILGTWQRAATICSFFLVLFFSYGHIYNLLKQTEFLGISLGRHRFLIPIWIAFFLVGIWWVTKKLTDLHVATEALNVFALAALAISAVQFASFGIHSSAVRQGPPADLVESENFQVSQTSYRPDIYYIILDEYTRDDILENIFAYDNKPFINQLSEMGFYVAQCSQSNYAYTDLSLASSLNLNYLQELGDQFEPSVNDKSPTWPFIHQNVVMSTLKSIGYTTIAFETGWHATQIVDADFYLSPRNNTSGDWEIFGGVNIFELMLIRTSAGLVVEDMAYLLPEFLAADVDRSYNKDVRDRVIYTLSMLGEIPQLMQSPKFIFAHILTPHDPFVFGPNGEFIEPPESVGQKEFISHYRDQVIHINKRIEGVVQQIMDNSESPPIIIIQADHGVRDLGPETRMSILNTYYLPGYDPESLYPSISPVNTFRIIFNTYFGGEFAILDDVSYYSDFTGFYNFNVIQDQRPGCQ